MAYAARHRSREPVEEQTPQRHQFDDLSCRRRRHCHMSESLLWLVPPSASPSAHYHFNSINLIQSSDFMNCFLVGHGVCDQATRFCTCESFWMENFLAVSYGGQHNCGKSNKYGQSSQLELIIFIVRCLCIVYWYMVIIYIDKRVLFKKSKKKRFVMEYWYWSHFKDCSLDDFVFEFHWSRERISWWNRPITKQNIFPPFFYF